MNDSPLKIRLDEWEGRYRSLKDAGMGEPWYGGPLSRHVEDGDSRLAKLQFDNSPAALRLWNFLLTEEDRLREARLAGGKLIGTMKDLGTVPVMAYSLPGTDHFLSRRGMVDSVRDGIEPETSEDRRLARPR